VFLFGAFAGRLRLSRVALARYPANRVCVTADRIRCRRPCLKFPRKRTREMKQFRSSRLWPCLLFALIFLAAGSARANCINPAGVEKDMDYNGDYHTYQFCNGTNWMSMAGGGGGSGPMSLISTQTASGLANIQFTNLPSSYNTLFLNCSGLLASSGVANNIAFALGEGAGPTWETGAHYNSYMLYGTAGSGPLWYQSTTKTDLTTGSPPSTTLPVALKIYIDNVGSSSVYKNVTFVSNASGQGYFASGSGYWNNDTNPITGAEVTINSGTFASGTCSLYGMN
jgi:hypothetical protein